VRSVIAAQSTRERRRAIADAVIFNDGLTPEGLADEVSQLWTLWGLHEVKSAD
jgi:dephospho-CoA kinase